MDIIQLGVEDLPRVLDFRLAMMEESGVGGLLAPDWRELTWQIYETMYARGTGVHYGVRVEGRLVATAGCLLKEDFPLMTLKHRRLGWIMDVYVEPDQRRKGYARALTERVLAWLKEREIRVVKLSASRKARDFKLYESFGFEPTSEMMLRLGQA